MEHKCPACGFRYHQFTNELEFTDLDHCLIWTHLYSINKGLPTKQQFESMQREGFLPTHKKYNENNEKELDGKEYVISYGYYGWEIDYNWDKIAQTISVFK